jgi:hypothetical protein
MRLVRTLLKHPAARWPGSIDKTGTMSDPKGACMKHSVLTLFLLAGFAASGHSQWSKTNWTATSNYFDLYGNQNHVVARTWDALNAGRTFVTSDNGANWTVVAADSSLDILSVVVLSDTLLAGTWNGLISATIGGTSWTVLSPAGMVPDIAVYSISMINAALYAGAVGAIYMSSDHGGSWTEVKTGIPAGSRITSFAAIGNAVFAASAGSGVYVTTDAAAGWTAVNAGLTDLNITRLVTMGNQLFAVTQKGGAFVSGNNGTSWTGITLAGVNCLVVAAGRLFAGTDTAGIYMSSDNGTTWETVPSSGLAAGSRIWSMAVAGASLMAATGDGVWTVPLSSLTADVRENNVPGTAVLERNYPNPFNPATTIGFMIPVPENVSLAIYNATGQKIRTLVDAPMPSGAHRVVWDGLTDAGMHVPSGVYLYELRAGTFRDAKKFLLMR